MTSPEQILTGIIEIYKDDLSPYELAAAIIDAGFIWTFGNITQQIIQHTSYEAARVIADGDVADCAAYVPGEVGRGSAISGRDSLLEDPAGWLEKYAKQLGEPDD